MLACGNQPAVAGPRTTPTPTPIALPAGSTSANSRFGIDYVITISLRLGNGWFAGPIKYRPGGLVLKKSDRLPAEEYMDDYRAWITALVERYKGDGEADMNGLRYPILHYQVGNEYANPAFGDSYETVWLEGGPDGVVVELSPEPVLFQAE